MTCSPDAIMEQVLCHDRLWLFLDYDGTLADFAATPAAVDLDPDIVALVTRLTVCECIRVAVISGRALSQLWQLLPVPHLFLGGTYGVELYTPDGEFLYRAESNSVRPALEQLKPIWQQLIARRAGFFLEDKGWALALHARFAAETEADRVLAEARASIQGFVVSDKFRVLHGHRFLEVAPAIAHKGQTVRYLLDRFAWPSALPVYLGDDDKDEDAFEAVKAYQGVALVVSALRRETLADAQLSSPQAARDWLNALADRVNAKAPL